MASSTTRPIDNTKARSVSVLMEKPKAYRIAKLVISETGMVTSGIIEARTECRKTKTVRPTRSSASVMVFATARIDRSIKTE